MPATVPALDTVNDDFHRAYDDARDAAELDGPVLVLLVDTLYVHTASGVRTHAIRPPWIDSLKSAAHAPVAAFAMLHGSRGHAVAAKTRVAMARLSNDCARARAPLVKDAQRDGSTAAVRLLDETLELLAQVRDDGSGLADDLDRFAARCREDLLSVTEAATRAQLAALDLAVHEALESLDARARAALQVVVAGDHQARSRSLGMQYFQKRLGEPPSAELRVTFGENVASLEDALVLVGKRRLDRALARAFFGDPQRLQRDVLGDMAASILARADLTPIA